MPQSSGTLCTGKSKLHLPGRQKERENRVSGCPWNIQMLLIFIAQVIPTSDTLLGDSWHTKKQEWSMTALLAWPFSLFPAVIGPWCHLILYRLFIKKSKTEQVFSSTSCSIKKKNRREKEKERKKLHNNINHTDGHKLFWLWTAGCRCWSLPKETAARKYLVKGRMDWVTLPCGSLMYYLNYSCNESLGSLGSKVGKVGSAMGWKEGRDDIEVGVVPAFQDFPENKAILVWNTRNKKQRYVLQRSTTWTRQREDIREGS